MVSKKSKKVASEEVAEQDNLVEEVDDSLLDVDETTSVEGTTGSADNDAGVDLEKLVAELEEEKRQCQDKMLRMAAELENFKRRMERDKQNALKFAEEGLLKELLPTIDNLERALAMEQTHDDAIQLHEGVELTLKGLLAAVEKFGLTSKESVGQPFDPNIHEALVMEASSEVPAQSIITEFEKGYHYKDRLLRAAKVVVSKGEEVSAP